MADKRMEGGRQTRVACFPAACCCVLFRRAPKREKGNQSSGGQRDGYFFSDLKSTLLLFQLMLFVVLFPIKYFNAHQTFGSSSSACLAYLLLVRQQTAVPSFVCLPYRPFGSLLLEESYSSFVAEVGPYWPSGLDLLVVDLLAYSSVDRLCLPLS